MSAITAKGMIRSEMQVDSADGYGTSESLGHSTADSDIKGTKSGSVLVNRAGQSMKTTNTSLLTMREDDEGMRDSVQVLGRKDPLLTMNAAEFRQQFGANANVQTRFSKKLQAPAVPIHTINFSPTNSTELVPNRNDYAYRELTWDGAPIVIQEYSLVFFTVPKVGCTVFKQLFRRINGSSDWQKYDEWVPHCPEANGLTYLWNFSPEQVTSMLTSSNWTKAIFLRDPKERILSAYLDKGVNYNDYLEKFCCPDEKNCKERARSSFRNFLELTATCWDPHWNPQTWRMEAKYWPYINFVGRLESVRDDTRRLLERIGAWNSYGATGWGESGKEAIFSSVKVYHQTGSNAKLAEYYDAAELEDIVEKLYEDDYKNPLCNFSSHRIHEQ